MSEEVLSFTIQGDSEGYITFSCPYCHSEFKLRAEEFQNDDDPISELFCPYCGLAKEYAAFYSDDVIEKIQAMATNYMFQKLNAQLGKMARSTKNSIIKMTYKPLKEISIKELSELDTQETAFTCTMCGRHIKALYCIGVSKVFCPYCGVDI